MDATRNVAEMLNFPRKEEGKRKRFGRDGKRRERKEGRMGKERRRGQNGLVY